MTTPRAHVDHAKLIHGPLPDGPAVTRACLECHANAAHDFMKTGHWTWAAQTIERPGAAPITNVGKRNVINNFCIHAGPNIARCSLCHAGYGWKDNSFDFSREENVDCLVCHEQTGQYQKGEAGQPAQGVDLIAAAKSVGRPTRNNCGTCHFKGGGANAVKHGDIDGSLYHPPERIDVHMGRLNLQCVDCHRTERHEIPGYMMSIGSHRAQRVACTDCHAARPHRDKRLDAHTQTVACETCHIPRMAIDWPTKMWWDWSAAGQDGRPEDPYSYLKQKGSFRYAQNVRPEYAWYNGRAQRYASGDKINPQAVVEINRPLGGPSDPEAKIWPFKMHRGKQPYDQKHLHLLTPKTAGPGGYWTDFNWDQACRLGAESTGVPYSGSYAFVETVMYWPLSHMVGPTEKALQCTDCHGDRGILDWKALGFEGDPATRGDRRRTELVRGEQGGVR